MTQEMTMNGTRQLNRARTADASVSRTAHEMLTVSDYEARIHLYKEQIGVGYIGIGRTLNEAKEAGVVPAGQWEAWVVDVTGLTVRQAQRCMQAAREIRDGSQLARLEMSKAMRLLSSGLDEDQREELAKKTAEDDLTVKALEEEIRKLQQGHDQAVELSKMWAERARQSFEEGQKAAERGRSIEDNLALVKKDEEIRKLRQDVARAQSARDTMERNMNRETGKAGELALQVDRLRQQLHEAEQAAKSAEARIGREAQLQRTIDEQTGWTPSLMSCRRCAGRTVSAAWSRRAAPARPVRPVRPERPAAATPTGWRRRRRRYWRNGR